MNLLRNIAIVVILLGSMPPARADLIWSIDLNDPMGTVPPPRTLVITGTLSNSITSTENLGVIGGTAGDPPGFDYEVGGLGFVSTGYIFNWAPDSAASFITQFEGVDLAPGESFDFEFARLTPTALVAPDTTYTSSLQLQLFAAPRPGPMIASSSDSVSWTVTVPEPGTLALLSLGLVGVVARRRKKA